MQAIDKKLHVYKSSAGSGKTTTLSIVYLKLALAKKDAFKHILALTFTNKASQEMKDRILEYLSDLIKTDEKKPLFFLDELIIDIPKYQHIEKSKSRGEALRVLRQDALLLYRKLLHHYSEYAVTTIDSFTNRLIRSFSHDLGLSFNYQVELDSNQMLKDAVEELVNRIGVKEDLITRVLTRYSRQKIDNESSRRINNDLENRAKSLLNDVEEKFLKPLRELSLEDILEVQKHIEKEIAIFENQLQGFGKQFIEICQNVGIDAKMFYQGRSSIYPYFEKLANKKYKDLAPNSYVLKIIETGEWTSKSAPPANKQLIDSVSDSLVNIYQNTQQFIESKSSDYIMMSQIKKSIFPYMLLMELEKILNQMKTENEMVHISDFNKIISEKIANESAPYIYERIGNKYNHYLLDEFQDTSVIQWHNLLPLMEDSLSENHFNLIVGDAKQSIYRWRGSDVAQFANLPKLQYEEDDQLSRQRENMLINSFHEITLAKNYRSGKAIVDFNNQLFQFIIDHNWLPESQKTVYADFTQIAERLDIDASVDIHLIDPGPKSNKDDYAELYQNQTAEIIRECIANGYELKDIAILARNNSILNELAQFLLADKIPVVSSESLYVESSQKVQFILSLLRHIEEPKEAVYQVEIIRHLLENASLGENHSESLENHLMRLDVSDELHYYWNEMDVEFDKTALQSLEAYEVVESLARLLKLDTKEPLFHFFVEASYIFTREKHQGIKGFLDWWAINHNDFKLDVPEDLNAVKLMSFHKSKGLQFPIVINWFSQKHIVKTAKNETVIWIDPQLDSIPEIKSFPFPISKLKDTKHHDKYQKEIELEHLDMINLFYVALTRPKEKLFLLVDKYEEKKSKSESTVFRFDKLTENFIVQSDLKQLDDGVFHLGTEDSKKKDSESKTDNSMVFMKSVDTENWRKHIKLAVERNDDKAWNESAAWGQKVHAVLAEINTEDDIDLVFKRLIYRGGMNIDEQVILSETVKQVVQHPQLKTFYQSDAQIYNEREIIGNDGKIYRPDRMVALNNTIIIIDYKTGHPIEKDKKQVQQYMQLAAEFTQQSVKGFLVYLHDEIVVEEVKK